MLFYLSIEWLFLDMLVLRTRKATETKLDYRTLARYDT